MRWLQVVCVGVGAWTSACVVNPVSTAADAAVVDGGVTQDAAVPVDAAVPDAAAVSMDAAVNIDAAMAMDAAVNIDAAVSMDASVTADAAMPADAAVTMDASMDGWDGGTHVALRVVAANLTSGNQQTYDPGHGTRILQGLKPDVVLLQEFNVGDDSTEDIRAWVESIMGPGARWYRESGNFQIPNGILSRYPIRASGSWNDTEVNNRDFAWARVDIPGPRDLWAVSVHLLTTGSGTRNREAQQLVQHIRAQVPAGDLLVVGGDFNTETFGESAHDTLDQVVVPHDVAGRPADQDGVTGTNAGRDKPYDGVRADADLHAHAVPVVLGSNMFPDGLVLDTRVYTPLLDVAPARQEDSAATNMQHMAVVRDYLVPVF